MNDERSSKMKSGLEKAPHRSLLYALGLTREEMERPLIGVVNAANEVVNLAFRQDKCGFLQMAEVIAKTLERVPYIKEPSLEDYLETDRIARITATELL